MSPRKINDFADGPEPKETKKQRRASKKYDKATKIAGKRRKLEKKQAQLLKKKTSKERKKVTDESSKEPRVYYTKDTDRIIQSKKIKDAIEKKVLEKEQKVKEKNIMYKIRDKQIQKTKEKEKKAFEDVKRAKMAEGGMMKDVKKYAAGGMTDGRDRSEQMYPGGGRTGYNKIGMMTHGGVTMDEKMMGHGGAMKDKMMYKHGGAAGKMESHSKGHSKAHMDSMNKDMHAGDSFDAAHKKAMKKVGK